MSNLGLFRSQSLIVSYLKKKTQTNYLEINTIVMKKLMLKRIVFNGVITAGDFSQFSQLNNIGAQCIQ